MVKGVPSSEARSQYRVFCLPCWISMGMKARKSSATCEVVSVPVGELIDRVERERAGKYGVTGRDTQTAAGHPELRPHWLPGQPLELADISEPRPQGGGEYHDTPAGDVEHADQLGDSLRGWSAAHHHIKHVARHFWVIGRHRSGTFP